MKQYCKIPPLRFGICLGINLLAAVCQTAVALIIQMTIDTAVAGDYTKFRQILLFTGAFLIGYFLTYYTRNVYTQKIADDFIADLRKKLYERMIDSSYEKFRQRPVSDYLSILTNDIHVYQEGAVKSRLLVVQNLISLLVVSAALIAVSPAVTLVIAVCTFLIYLLPQIVSRRIRTVQGQVSEKLSVLTEYSENNLEGFYTILTFFHQKKSKEQFHARNQEYNYRKIFLDRLMGKSETMSMGMSVGTELLVLFLCAGMVMRGSMTAGTMVAVMQLTGAFVQPLTLIMQNIPRITGGKAVEERFTAILEQEGRKEELEVPVDFRRDIRVSDLEFSYREGKTVLSGIDFTFVKGKKYALTGESGSGKTTLIKLLNGIYPCREGEIFVDGKRIGEKEAVGYGSLFATAGQNVFLFNTTILENITLLEEPKWEQLEKACQVSGVEEILSAFPKGIHTKISDNGAGLSGGQKQKIALARAVYHKKPILILDEGTSAIDKKSAAQIEKKLLEIPNLTLISITHDIRSPLLKQYDEVLYMSQGKIQEAGTWEELCGKGKAFAGFVNPA